MVIHTPGEHTIDSLKFDLELQIIYKKKDDYNKKDLKNYYAGISFLFLSAAKNTI
jgi:hypothetical protein